MENGTISFQSASELKSEEIESIKRGYIRGAILRDLIITVVSFVLVGIVCSYINSIPMSLSVIVLCISLVAGMFNFVAVITELVILGRIGKRDFTWITGEVERYQVHTVHRSTYIYAVIENNFCNIWGNPFYGKGTEVYLLEVGSGLIKQKVMVSNDNPVPVLIAKKKAAKN